MKLLSYRMLSNLTNGGVAEFEIANPTIALQGSGTADAPNIILYLVGPYAS